MFARIGPMELVLILAVALIVVGPAKLPEVGSALGKTIRGFRESMKDLETSFDDKPARSPRQGTATSSPGNAPAQTEQQGTAQVSKDPEA